jgi:cytochrome c oxidase subunit IV
MMSMNINDMIYKSNVAPVVHAIGLFVCPAIYCHLILISNLRCLCDFEQQIFGYLRMQLILLTMTFGISVVRTTFYTLTIHLDITS